MPKNKRPQPRKSATPPEEKEEVLSQALSSLALALSEREEDEDALRASEREFQRLLRRYLNQQKDEILYGAIELARDEDIGAYQLLRSAIEDAACTQLLTRENAPPMEIDAFAIPLFVHSRGGLVQAETFQDEAAYSALLASFSEAGLESPRARLVLVQHAYDADEAIRIGYSQMHAMAREAAASLTDKKMREAPALQRSIAGWAPSAFGPEDEAMELRFLLGFSLKRADDPFYQVPQDEAAADAWFATRMQRYQAWTEKAAPLLRRCLASAGRSLELNFLYQDHFFSARRQALAERGTLALIAELGAAARSHGGPVHVRIAPAEAQGEVVLRAALYGGDQLLASSNRPFDLGDDLQEAVEDLRDALGTQGITDIRVEEGGQE
ncbi:DUF2863 family protein [Massilia endophytica]|uniref:DUF2863 family protein n=1 Tax=Massilia endophytica TaxID=2899220 RepID=UPI001E63AA38|nr:DUF2863 family protein [Massilia endophytica]UGQ45733.1 DUF2863 family protein [Massilia endophytica]